MQSSHGVVAEQTFPLAQSDTKSVACFLPLPLGIQSAPELQEADVPLPCVVPIAVEKECGCNYIE